MAKYVYIYTGSEREHFSFLPADPPSQWLGPDDQIICTEPVEHPRLQLRETAKRAKPEKREVSDMQSPTTPKEEK